MYPDRNDKTTVSKVRLDQLEAQSNELKQLKERLAIDRARQHDSASSSVAGSVTSPMSASLTTWPSNHGGNEDSPPLASRVLKDQDGKERSFGSTSGASFLQQIKEFVKTCQMLCELKFEREAVPDDSPGFYSDGMVQTEDSRPLPYNTRANPSLVPNNTVRTSMLNQFRYAIQDGNGDFDSGGIYYWANFDSSLLDERTDGSLVKPQPHKGLPPGLAIYHAAFAFNLLINPAISPAMPNSGCPADHWLEYFSRARRLVGNPLDTTESSKADIPALTLLSVFNVEMNRRDAAYMFISIATRLAIRDGVHCAPDQDEATIRAFWTLYILDRWVAHHQASATNQLTYQQMAVFAYGSTAIHS